MRDWQIQLHLDEGVSDIPVFARIAGAVSEDISRGRLEPGDRLPGTRPLARSLGVHRNTVLAAYRELEAQGWIRTDPARGTFVSGQATEAGGAPAPRRCRRTSSMAKRVGFDVRPLDVPLATPAADGVLSFAGGRPDPRLFPSEPLARAYRRVLRRHGKELLDYGSPFGHERLREALSSLLSRTRGVVASADDVLVTRGSQMGLWLVFQSLVQPGERVAVEALGYPPAWQAMRAAGAEVCPVPVDESGLCVEEVEKLARRGRLKAVYVTPHHQFPTMVTLNAERRLVLLSLAARYGFAIVEDDYDNEYHYEGRPIPPIMAHDETGNVVYVGTLSKVLAPGLRIGFVVAPRRLLDAIARQRTRVDRQGDQVTECAVAELMEDGELQRHVFRMRRVYRARRDALVAGFRSSLRGVVEFDVPSGGLALWVRVQSRVNLDAWLTRAEARGVAFQPGRLFAFDGKPLQRARFGYARLNERELEGASRILVETLSRTSR